MQSNYAAVGGEMELTIGGSERTSGEMYVIVKGFYIQKEYLESIRGLSNPNDPNLKMSAFSKHLIEKGFVRPKTIN